MKLDCRVVGFKDIFYLLVCDSVGKIKYKFFGFKKELFSLILNDLCCILMFLYVIFIWNFILNIFIC